MTESPYFLTRNHANIIEDLARRLGMHNHLDVIVGDHGTGKTRLLKEFIKRRAGSSPVVWLYFESDGSCRQLNEATGESSTPNSLMAGLQELEKDALVIIDSLESTAPIIVHRLIEFITRHAGKRKVKFLVAGTSECLKTISKLSISEKIEISSVKLMPLDGDESLQFLAERMGRQPDEIARMPRKLNYPLRRKWRPMNL